MVHKVFGKHWFAENQKPLLQALNNPFAGWAARRGLWIEDRKHPVVKITPESYHVLLPDGKVKATIYATNQYAQALHKNAKPLWEALHWWDMQIANRLVPSLNAGFDTYTSQPDATAGLDTYLRQADPTGNNGTAQVLYIGETLGNTELYRTLIKFDYSSIPTTADVDTATLSLWQFGEASGEIRTHRVYRQKRDWVESQATWNIWKTSNNWQTAGGFGANDCEQTDIGSLSLSNVEPAGEKQWSLTASAVEEQINGTFTNNGYLMKADTEFNDRQDFRSSDYGTAGERPKMVSVYSVVSNGAWFAFAGS